MQFVNPFFLFGLFALAIPLIIHLFNFRKFKKVWFTNVKLLEEFTQQTRHESKLKHLLILIFRLLAFTCLIIAFAQPVIKDKTTSTKFSGASSAVAIYIDNSFSMESGSINDNLIEEAKKKAVEIVSTFKTSDLFAVTTNDFEGIHQRWVNKDEFTEMIENINLSSSVRSMSEILQRQKELFQNMDKNTNKFIFLVSDFQKSVCDFQNLVSDTTCGIFVIPLVPQEIANIYIDTVWLHSPVTQIQQNIEMSVVIKNISNVDLEKIPVNLTINGFKKAVASVDINANSSSEIKLVFTIDKPGIQHACLEIADSPVNYDDKLYFCLNVNKTIPVLNIYGENATNYIKSLFGNDSTFLYNECSENKINYSLFPNCNLIILNEIQRIPSGLAQDLKKFVDNGGSLAIFPSLNADLNSYNEFLNLMEFDNYLKADTANTKVVEINLQHPLFNDVFEKIPDNINLPIANFYYPLTKNVKSNRECLLKMQNGESFLSVQSYGSGKVYLSAVPLNRDASNFARHAIFVPVMYRMALTVEPERKLYYYTAKEEIIPLKGNIQGTDMVFRLKKINGDFEIIPGIVESIGNINISTYGQIKEAGNYDVLLDKDTICGLAFNYDRRESLLEYYSPSELTKAINKYNLKTFKVIEPAKKDLAQTLIDIRNGIKLWKLFVVLALIFLTGEIITLRFF